MGEGKLSLGIVDGQEVSEVALVLIAYHAVATIGRHTGFCGLPCLEQGNVDGVALQAVGYIAIERFSVDAVTTDHQHIIIAGAEKIRTGARYGYPLDG